jgi:hypothetical protein
MQVVQLDAVVRAAFDATSMPFLHLPAGMLDAGHLACAALQQAVGLVKQLAL